MYSSRGAYVVGVATASPSLRVSLAVLAEALRIVGLFCVGCRERDIDIIILGKPRSRGDWAVGARCQQKFPGAARLIDSSRFAVRHLLPYRLSSAVLHAAAPAVYLVPCLAHFGGRSRQQDVCGINVALFRYSTFASHDTLNQVQERQ